MSTEALFYLLRPNSTALWVPEYVLTALGVEKGSQLTAAQYENSIIQGLLADRSNGKKTDQED